MVELRILAEGSFVPFGSKKKVAKFYTHLFRRLEDLNLCYACSSIFVMCSLIMFSFVRS